MLTPPLEATASIVLVPTVVDEAAVRVNVMVPDAGLVTVAGEKLAVTPVGSPKVESVNDELNE